MFVLAQDLGKVLGETVSRNHNYLANNLVKAVTEQLSAELSENYKRLGVSINASLPAHFGRLLWPCFGPRI